MASPTPRANIGATLLRMARGNGEQRAPPPCSLGPSDGGPNRVSFGTTRPPPGFVLGAGIILSRSPEAVVLVTTQGSWAPSQLPGIGKQGAPTWPRAGSWGVQALGCNLWGATHGGANVAKRRVIRGSKSWGATYGAQPMVAPTWPKAVGCNLWSATDGVSG